MNVVYFRRDEVPELLEQNPSNSADFAIVASAPFLPDAADALKRTLRESARVLKRGALLFLQGRPEELPRWATMIGRSLRFKYWIAVRSALIRRNVGLPSCHAGIVMFVKDGGRFSINKVRFAHKCCAFCNRTLKDWGGKSHLMHPEGYALSDVWKDLPPLDNYTGISFPVLETLLRMVDVAQRKLRGFIGPLEGISFDPLGTSSWPPERRAKVSSASAKAGPAHGGIEEKLLDVVHLGEALEVLKRYPGGSVDLAFADPPYNLSKLYESYEDRKQDEKYISWCNLWLEEYARVLKPTGSLYVLNLPRWAIHHAAFLNEHLHFQNWIVWDGISEPRGKIMPAHYALLFYTKHPTKFTFNYEAVKEVDWPAFCLRASCVKERKRQGIDPKVVLTDIWSDIHRIKHRRDRDFHPCQLPLKLMERIILLSSNEGDIVLDAFCGTGTTAVAAAKLKRRYVAVDIDEKYAEMTRRKVREMRERGLLARKREVRVTKPVTKKELQLELRNLGRALGRLPTEEDIRAKSRYSLELFKENFPTWGKALKAAKLAVGYE